MMEGEPMKEEEEEEWVLARKGIQLVLNNRHEEAQKLFSCREDSIQLAAGHCFTLFMKALMSFEEDMIAESQATLRELEKKCAQDIGWLKSMRNKVFGTTKEKSEAARLEEQIILADTQVCLALSAFLQQDRSGCVRGGWALRKAWRAYQHTYNQLLTLYCQTFGPSNNVPGSEFLPWRVVLRSPSTNMVESPSCDWTAPASPVPLPSPGISGYRNPLITILNALTPTTQSELKPEDISRLMSAVSFGYGVFQLCISLLPPSVIKVVQVLGFGSDRAAGLDALMFSCKGKDMRAPLATLSLLWYHTIVRPFFALDGNNIEAGVDTAVQLISDCQPDFSNSPFFLFFTGRIHRLKSDIPAALESYLLAVDGSSQKQIQFMCLYEVSWCYLSQLDWSRACQSFLSLNKHSNWTNIFCTYLAAVCAGANNQLKVAANLSREVFASLAYNPQSEMIEFVHRRVSLLRPAPSSQFCRLLAYEMLLFWNALPDAQHVDDIIEDCKMENSEEPMVGLSNLLLGTAQRFRGLHSEAEASLYATLNARQDLSDSAIDSHITAFALYELSQLLMLKTSNKSQEEARCLLKRIQRDFKGYDFEFRLNILIHTALHQDK